MGMKASPTGMGKTIKNRAKKKIGESRLVKYLLGSQPTISANLMLGEGVGNEDASTPARKAPEG